jgi:hypothetical protein
MEKRPYFEMQRARKDPVDVRRRFELFLLGDGEKKCTEAADTRMLP